MKKADKLNALSVRDHALAAHADFIELISRRIKSAALKAAEHDLIFAANPGEESERNKAAIGHAKVLGLKDALRLYGGKKGGVVAVEDEELQRILFQVRAQMRSRMHQFTEKACYRANQVWTTPATSIKHQQARALALNLHGQIEAFQDALEVYDKCFNDLESRACLV